MDGTLHESGIPNTKVIAWLRVKKLEGFELVLWSARGQRHAQRAIDNLGLAGLFDVVISKPGYIVDDKGWAWIKWTKIVTSFEK